MLSWERTLGSNPATTYNFSYDPAGQLKNAVLSSGGSTLHQYYYNFDAAGNRISAQADSNVTQTTPNSANQISSIAAGGPTRFQGTISQPGTVTVNGQKAFQSTSTNFVANPSLSGGTNTVAVVATNGNGAAQTNSYQVVIPPSGTITPSYDLDGNMTSNGNGQTYTWDAENRLLSITYTGGATTTFTYDGLGRCVQLVDSTGATKQFIWDGLSMAEQRNGTSVTARFFPEGEQISGTSYYYTFDHLGSVRELTDGSGNIDAQYDYDPYGNVSLLQGSNMADFQYAGMYEHQKSGLNLTLFRAYDPNAGRWLSRDPLGEGADATLYSYVSNDPIILIDPLGLLSQAAWQYVNSALNSSDGNLSVANDWLVVARIGDEKNVPLRDAQHFLYAASACHNSPWGTPIMVVGIPIFSGRKAVLARYGALSPLESDPSFSEMEAGYEGIPFGLGYTGDPPPLLPIVSGPGTSYPYASSNVSPTASTGGASTGD